MLSFACTMEALFFAWFVVLQGAVSQPTIIEVPQTTEAMVGETTEFSCKVREEPRQTYQSTVFWCLRVDSGSLVKVYHIAVDSEDFIRISSYSNLHHGSYKTRKHVLGRVTEYQLQIENVTQNDDLFQLSCAFTCNVNHIKHWASLTVLFAPKISPKCSYMFKTGKTPVVIPQEGIDILLSCKLQDGEPLPNLSWRMNGQQLTEKTYK